MRLSYSAISTFRNCPLKYKLTYIDRLPTKKTPALGFGESIHLALAYMYDVQLPKPPSLEKVITYLEKNFSSEGFKEATEKKAYLEHAKQAITNFYNLNVEDFNLPVALEQKFYLDIEPGLTLTGIVDRLDKDKNGAYEVIDYKTTRKLPPLVYINKDLQLSIYHLAVKEVWGFSADKLSLYFILPNQKLSTKRTETDDKNTRDLVKKTAFEIAQEKFIAKENPLCPWCDFQASCPFFKQKFKKEETPIDIIETVNEYGRLKDTQKETKASLDGLAAKIHQHLIADNLNRLFTDDYEVSRSERKSLSYDEEKLKNLLESEGLLEKVLSIDTKKIDVLLEDGLSEDTKKALELLKQVKTSYFLIYKKTKS